MTSTSAQSLSHSLDKLKLSSKPTVTLGSKKSEPVESWEDEASDDGEDVVPDIASPFGADAPPPTPASPSIKTETTSRGSQFQTFPPFGMNGSSEAGAGPQGAPQRPGIDGDKRPEKTTSTAARLIAAGIGQKMPRRTKEQREYDQAMKVQEKKKRDAAREEEERKKLAKEQAIKDVWGD